MYFSDNMNPFDEEEELEHKNSNTKGKNFPKGSMNCAICNHLCLFKKYSQTFKFVERLWETSGSTTEYNNNEDISNETEQFARNINGEEENGNSFLHQIISNKLKDFVKIHPNGEIQLNMSEELSITL